MLQSVPQARNAAAMSTFQTTQPSGVTLDFCQEQKQPVAESAQGQKCQAHQGWSSPETLSVVKTTISFL